MIKIDRYKAKYNQKRYMLAGGILAVFITLYTVLLVGIDILLAKLGIKKLYIVMGNIFLIVICLIWFERTDYGLIDFLKPYTEYFQYVLIIDPVRLIIAGVYGIAFLFLGHRLNEGVDDWVIEEEKKKREKQLPYGEFDYEDRSHMLLFGATRMGKGVLINLIIQNILKRASNELLVVVSAKLASADEHSQLAYLRQMCKETGRKLYIVSMDEAVDDRCQYNPFKYLKDDEMRNALNNIIESDSRYYSNNFVQWVMSIYKAIRLGKGTVSIQNILKLYFWDSEDDEDSYTKYVKQLKDKGIINNDEYQDLTNRRRKKYAEVALNDSANLDNVVDSCSAVFDTTPNRKKVTITDAFKENAVIYFDLNGTSAGASVKMLGGACIMSELLHCTVAFSNPNIRKTIILDEASYYMNEHLIKAFYNTTASMGYQFIISTQGPSDISKPDEQLSNQLFTNLGQLACLQVGADADVEQINSIIGTTITAENTHRANSIDYDTVGSLKAVDQMIVPHDTIKHLLPLEMVYYQKKKSKNGQAKPVRVKLDVERL